MFRTSPNYAQNTQGFYGDGTQPQTLYNESLARPHQATETTRISSANNRNLQVQQDQQNSAKNTHYPLLQYQTRINST